MKTISFGVVEILPHLLDKSKTQTIRPAWKDEIVKTGVVLDEYKEIVTTNDKVIIEKPPRFKVGDKAKIYWKQRSEYKWFCSKCGIGVDDASNQEKGYPYSLTKHCGYRCTFNKLLGTAEITEVFKIEIFKGNLSGRFRVLVVKKNHSSIITDYHPDIKFINNLAERDGFSSAEEMFKWFDKAYDLSTPKQFYVYRWRWLK